MAPKLQIEALENRLPLNGEFEIDLNKHWFLQDGTENGDSAELSIDYKGPGFFDDTAVVTMELDLGRSKAYKTFTKQIFGFGSNGLIEKKIEMVRWNSKGGDDTFVNHTHLATYISASGGQNHFYGGSGPDTLLSGPGAYSYFYGGDGDDHLQGIGMFYGGAGDDGLIATDDPGATHPASILQGGMGNDILWGGKGSVHLFGGGGDDELHGGDGQDYLYGGPGNDLLYGDDPRFDIEEGEPTGGQIGNQGDDLLFGGPGNDRLWGRWGNDYLDGGSGDDVIEGEGGNDTIVGGAGNDHLFGGWWENAPFDQAMFDGDDEIDGQDGSDYLYGGFGNDILFGGHDWSVDYLYGNAGSDVFKKKLQSWVLNSVTYQYDVDQIMDLSGEDTLATV